MGQKWEGALGIGKEGSYGEGTAPAIYIAVVRANADTERISPEDGRATGQRPLFRSVITGLDFTFSWEQWAEPRNIGEILELLMGTLNTTTPGTFTGDETRHTFDHASSIDSFSLSIDRGVGTSPAKRYVGARINTFTLESAPRDVVTVSVEGFAQQESNQAALAPSLAEFEYDPFTFDELSMSIGLAGSAPALDQAIERVSITISNDLISDKVTANSTLYIAELPIGRFRVSGEFDREFESITEYNAFVANSQIDMLCEWNGDTIATNPYRLYVDIPNARITSLPLPEIAGASERSTYTVAFEGFYYSTDSRALQIILDNDVTSYP